MAPQLAAALAAWVGAAAQAAPPDGGTAGPAPAPPVAIAQAAAGVLDGGLDAGAPPLPVGLGFGPGESLTYAVTYFGASAGSSRIEVGSAAPRGGTAAWPVVVTATSAGVADKVYQVRDRYVDWWDPVSARSVESGLAALEGGHRSGFHIHFHPGGPDGGVVTDTQVWDGNESETTHRVLTPNAQDILSAIFWLRTQRLAIGDRYTVPVFMGKVEWPLGAAVLGLETVPTQLGPIDCVHLRLSASFKGKLGNRRDLDAYFSVDSRHLPVLLAAEVVVGRLRVLLTRVQGDTPGVSH